MIPGETPMDGLGLQVSDVGDVDGDGFADVLVSAAGDQTGANRGSVRLFSGYDGHQIFGWHGDLQYNGFAASIGAAGDVDGDGIPDVVVGAVDSPSGRAYVFSGWDGGLLHLFEGDAAGDNFSQAAGAGDVDLDGFADIVVAGSTSDANGVDSGVVKIFSGFDGSVLQVHLGHPGDLLGYSVAGAGDIDGDGYADVIAGAPFAQTINGPASGKAIVWSGRTGGVLHEFIGNMAQAGFGHSVAGPGDVNGDGRDDLLVGSPGDGGFPQFPGSARVLSGLDGTILHEWMGAGDQFAFGNLVARMGDIDGDGRADLGVLSSLNTTPQGFQALVYSGFTGSPLYTLGPGSLGMSFRSLSGAGDVDGDGYPDIVTSRIFTGDPAGTVYVFSGKEHVVPFCFGDGSGTACPCGNVGGPGGGCANSTGSGAALAGTGSASLSDDDLVLGASGMVPTQPAQLFAGTNASNGGSGLPFGDGLRCAGGGVRRLGVRTPDGAGAANWGPGLAATGAWSPGDLRRFQVWYRDPGVGSPCGTGFNLTNGVEVAFSL